MDLERELPMDRFVSAVLLSQDTCRWDKFSFEDCVSDVVFVGDWDSRLRVVLLFVILAGLRIPALTAPA
jgi:hypothetical protein